MYTSSLLLCPPFVWLLGPLASLAPPGQRVPHGPDVPLVPVVLRVHSVQVVPVDLAHPEEQGYIFSTK